jgi:hypothetical protein
MYERSFIVKYVGKNRLPGLRQPTWLVLGNTRFKDAALRRRFRHSAQPDAPELFEISCQAGQDFVSHAAGTVCETTGTGCAAGSKPANGSGVGCPMN